MNKKICKITLIVTISIPFLSGCSITQDTPQLEYSSGDNFTSNSKEDTTNNQKNSITIEKEIQKEEGFRSIEEYEKANKDSFNKVKKEAIKTTRKLKAEEKIALLKEQSVKKYHENLLSQQGLKASGGEITRTEKGLVDVSLKETKELDKDGKEVVHSKEKKENLNKNDRMEK